MKLTPEQRLALIDHINALVQVDFERLVFALDAPRSVLPSNYAAQGDRAAALLVWVSSPVGCGMGQLLKSLGAIAPLPSILSPSRLDAPVVVPSHRPVPLSTGADGVQIFLAHAKEDEAQVMELYERLRSKGYRPWLDKKDLLPGQNWREEIPRAISQSDIFVACLSSRSEKKQGYVQQEFRLALSILAQKPSGMIYLIPLRLDDCEIPDLRQSEYGLNMRDYQWLNYFESDGFDQLERAIVHQYSQPSNIRPSASSLGRQFSIPQRLMPSSSPGPVPKSTLPRKLSLDSKSVTRSQARQSQSQSSLSPVQRGGQERISKPATSSRVRQKKIAPLIQVPSSILESILLQNRVIFTSFSTIFLIGLSLFAVSKFNVENRSYDTSKIEKELGHIEDSLNSREIKRANLKEADQSTSKIFGEILGSIDISKSANDIDSSDIRLIPCDVIVEIDNLWRSASPPSTTWGFKQYVLLYKSLDQNYEDFKEDSYWNKEDGYEELIDLALTPGTQFLLPVHGIRSFLGGSSEENRKAFFTHLDKCINDK